MRNRKSYYAIVLAHGDDADFFTDSIYDDRDAAVSDFMTEHYEDEDRSLNGEYALVEFVGYERLDRVLKPKLTKVNVAKMVRKITEERDHDEDGPEVSSIVATEGQAE